MSDRAPSLPGKSHPRNPPVLGISETAFWHFGRAGLLPVTGSAFVRYGKSANLRETIQIENPL
jgi:hypothetical protein